MLVEKLFCSFFNPLISLYIFYDQYEKLWRKNKNNFFPAVRFHGNGAIFDFRALIKVHNYNSKTGTSNAVKSCTHIEDINEETYVFLVLLNITILIIFFM